jgi:two-component system OmpR family sensor kinase
MPLVILLPLSAMSMLRIARRASKPLQKLDAELAYRGGSDLNPLSTNDFPQELKPLVKTLNQLMLRLKSALESERNFAANSAHELRTPLAAATAQLHVLEKTILNEDQRKTLVASQQMLHRLQSLSEKLLQLARAESGIAWKSAELDLTELLRLICNDYQWRTVLQLQLSQPTSPVIIQGDIDALGIVLGNLLENAIKYASPGSPIQIEMSTSPIQICIINDCDPLQKTTIRRLHERFYRAHSDSQGSGLGLSIVNTLLKPTSIAFSIQSPAKGSHRGFEAKLTWL